MYYFFKVEWFSKKFPQWKEERKKVSNDFSSSVLQPFYFSFDVLFGLQGHQPLQVSNWK